MEDGRAYCKTSVKQLKLLGWESAVREGCSDTVSAFLQCQFMLAFNPTLSHKAQKGGFFLFFYGNMRK